MKKILLLNLLLPFYLLAQTPGGVSSPICWLMPSSNLEGNIELWEKTADDYIDQYANQTWFNYNPALSLRPEFHLPTIDLGYIDISQLQIFTVYLAQDSMREKAVWAIHDNVQDALLMTTHRLADFRQNKFINNLGNNKQQSQINSYQRFVDQTQQAAHHLVIGQKALQKNIPIDPFSGKLAEVIVFDHVLNSIDRAKVETYLAIKYGVGIEKQTGQSMLNAQGVKIWDTQQHFEYSNHIAAIGRDKASGLYQKQSGAVHFENIFSLALGEFHENNAKHPEELQDQKFLIWGENSEKLLLEDKQPGQIQKLKKNWKILNRGFTNEKTQLRFDVQKLPFEKNESDIFWLVIDQSGQGDYPLGQVQYIPMDERSGSEAAIFSNVQWGRSHEQIFTLATGPKMIPAVWIDQPQCHPAIDGTLHVAAHGGKSPYHIQLINDKGLIIADWQTNDSKTQELNNISPGDYELQITDGEGFIHQESFYINASDAIFSNLKNTYSLGTGGSLKLDASLGLVTNNISYRWLLPNGQTLEEPKISITEAGEYNLSIEQNGCRSEQRINIEKERTEIFKDVILFPNPSLGGYFEIRAALHQESALQIKIVNNSGAVVHNVRLADDYLHRYQVNLEFPGFYIIQLISQGQTTTHKLIVHRQP